MTPALLAPPALTPALDAFLHGLVLCETPGCETTGPREPLAKGWQHDISGGRHCPDCSAQSAELSWACVGYPSKLPAPAPEPAQEPAASLMDRAQARTGTRRGVPSKRAPAARRAGPVTDGGGDAAA